MDSFESHMWRGTATQSLPYRLRAPAKQSGRARPFIMCLHGAGERGDDNTAQLSLGIPDIVRFVDEICPSWILAPQCPLDDKWSDVLWEHEAHTMSREPTRALASAVALCEHLIRECGADESRVYLTGLSMGGFGSWEAAIRWPHRWTAVAPVCGGGDERCVWGMRHLPVWASHGARDSVVKVCRSRNMVAALKAAGGSPRYSEYPEVDHDAWNHAYRDRALYEWLFAQRSSPLAAGATSAAR